jgi:hypothetical protein
MIFIGTDTEYKDSLIAKLYLFKFVNSYSSLYYIAFLQQKIEGDCDGSSCMFALGENVAIIFLTRLFVGNVNQIVIPKLKQRFRNWKETKSTWNDDSNADKLSVAEKDYILESYDHIMSMITDYSDLCIQFGYVTLFVTAFPLAPFFAFISNLGEVRTDGYKLLYTYRRFEPYGAEDIGIWQQIFTLTAAIAVMTNSGIVFFTSTAIDLSNSIKVWLFFFVIIFVLLSMIFFSILVKPVTDPVQIQLEREDYLVRKLIRGEPDLHETDLVSCQSHFSIDGSEESGKIRHRIDIFNNDE